MIKHIIIDVEICESCHKQTWANKCGVCGKEYCYECWEKMSKVPSRYEFNKKITNLVCDKCNKSDDGYYCGMQSG